jgi:hypothetical protein
VDMLTQRIIGTTVNVAEERPRSSVAKVNLTPATISKAGSLSVGPFAWFVVAYHIAVILWGAYVRVSGSGAGAAAVGLCVMARSCPQEPNRRP